MSAIATPGRVLANPGGSQQAMGVRTLRLIALVVALALAGCAAGSSAGGQGGTTAARQQLDALTVGTASSMKGYSRDRFPHWRTANGCTTRETVLRRDGLDVVVDPRTCDVVSGRWLSVYENRWYDSASLVDVDHMVPLANAWRSGAGAWGDQQRGDFANDLQTPQLRAVSASTNRAKGDQDPSLWRPANRDFWCEYARSWIAVKYHWRLSVTAAEKDALIDMLETCTWQSNGPPTSSPAPVA